MRLLKTCLLMITSTTWVAQPLMSDASNAGIDCAEITTSPQINDCVHQKVTASNEAPFEQIRELVAINTRVIEWDG